MATYRPSMLVPPLPPAEIDVSPTALSFTLPPDGTDSASLTVSNLAAGGSEDLTWSLVDAEARIFVNTRGERIPNQAAKALPVEWKTERARVGLSSRSESVERQCTNCVEANSTAFTRDLSGDNLRATINDGSFEGGAGSGAWAETSTNYGTPLCTAAGCGTGSGFWPEAFGFTSIEYFAFGKSLS